MSSPFQSISITFLFICFLFVFLFGWVIYLLLHLVKIHLFWSKAAATNFNLFSSSYNGKYITAVCSRLQLNNKTISAPDGSSHCPTWLVAEQDPPCSSPGLCIGWGSCQSAGHGWGVRQALPAWLYCDYCGTELFVSVMGTETDSKGKVLFVRNLLFAVDFHWQSRRVSAWALFVSQRNIGWM